MPGVGQSLLVARVSTLSTDMPPGEGIAELAATGVTLALHLAAHRAEQIVEDLTPYYGADCPTATVAFASRPNQQVVRSPLHRLPEALDAEIRKTAVIFVGRVLDAAAHPEVTDSYLYSHARVTKLRKDPQPVSDNPEGRLGPTAEQQPEILVLGGTGEARTFPAMLDEAGAAFVSSLAGRVANPRLPVGPVRIGGFGGADGLREWLIANRSEPSSTPRIRSPRP